MPAPFLLPLAFGAGAGVLGGSVAALSGRDAARQRKTRISELSGQIARDDFGLSSQEKGLAQRELLDPIRALATQRQSQQEATAAASGMVSGADLSRLRQETGRGLAEAATDAGERIARLDVETAAREEQAARSELAAQQAAQEQRRADILRGFLGPLAPAAAMAGAMAGGPPEMRAGSILDEDALFTQLEASDALSPRAKAYLGGLSPTQRNLFARNLERAQYQRALMGSADVLEGEY
jgi:hypothetical protein